MILEPEFPPEEARYMTAGGLVSSITSRSKMDGGGGHVEMGGFMPIHGGPLL